MAFLPDVNSTSSQWHLQNQNYLKQINIAVNKNTAIAEIQTQLLRDGNYQAEQNQMDMLDVSNEIYCSLESGFAKLGKHLGNIDDGIYDLANITGRGFSQMYEQQKITNEYLGKISDLLRIPDRQKDRIYFIEEGLKYLINALNKEKDDPFYLHAIEEFQKATEIEKKDFFSLYYIGYIHLYSNIKDVVAAEKEFKEAGYFYLAEANAGGTSFSKSLPHSGIVTVATSLILEQKSINFRLCAAESFLHAANACYEQGRYADAASLAKESWETETKYSIAGLLRARYLILDGKIEAAINVLGIAIKQRADIYNQVAMYEDIRIIPKVNALLRSLKQSVLERATEKLDYCLLTAIENSAANNYLSKVQALVNSSDYCSLVCALKMLTVNANWSLERNQEVTNYLAYNKLGSSSIEFNGTVVEFVRFEKEKTSIIIAAETERTILKKLNAIRDDLSRKIAELERTKAPIEAQYLQAEKELNDSRKSLTNSIIGSVLFILVALLLSLHVDEYSRPVLAFLFKLSVFLIAIVVIHSLWQYRKDGTEFWAASAKLGEIDEQIWATKQELEKETNRRPLSLQPPL